MMEIDFTGFAITVLGYDDDTQAIGGISTLLIDGLAVEGRAHGSASCARSRWRS